MTRDVLFVSPLASMYDSWANVQFCGVNVSLLQKDNHLTSGMMSIKKT
jgi:hypothetical protein